MPEHIVSSQAIRDVLLPVLFDQRDDETLESVLMVPDETIATRAEELGYETEVVNES